MGRLFARIFLIMLLMVQTADAWNIGAKGRATASTIHATYFLTPNNKAFPVRAQAYVGTWMNGNCQLNAQYDLGADTLKTGDVVDIDGYQLLALVGGGYTCMTIYYLYQQLVVETFQLIWDGTNYVSSNPATGEATIL